MTAESERLPQSPIERCRACSSPTLIGVWDMGTVPLPRFGTDPAPTAPLYLGVCDPNGGGCGLVQLMDRALPPNYLYENYWYRSGTNETMVAELGDIVRESSSLLSRPLQNGDAVLDIGANDGTLLANYEPGLWRIAYEPAANFQNDLRSVTDQLVGESFGAGSAELVRRKVRVVSSIAMFYDLDKPGEFASEVAQLLEDDGVWVLQMSYLPAMLSANAVDNICHEHVTYYSLTTLVRTISEAGLRVVRARETQINGGSIRVFIVREESPIPTEDSTSALLSKDEIWNREVVANLKTFCREAIEAIGELSRFVARIKAQGSSIAAYGASTKGITLLHLAQLNRDQIEHACDRNRDKWNLFYANTGIPIVSELESRRRSPDYYLVLPWGFRKSFIAREQQFMREGGRMIFPLPVPTVLGATREVPLKDVFPA